MNHITSKIKNLKKLILPGTIVVLGILFYAAYYSQLTTERSYVFIQLQPLQTSKGWGYEILANGKTYIHQEFIPAIEGQHAFKTKEDALVVGNKVIEKIKLGEQLPTISIEELKQMGVLKDSLR